MSAAPGWTDAEEAALVALYRAGEPTEQIAIPGRSNAACRQRISRLIAQGIVAGRYGGGQRTHADKRAAAQEASEAAAEAAVIARAGMQQRKARRCLGCAREFASHGPGHRLCQSCRASAAGDSGSYAVVVPR